MQTIGRYELVEKLGQGGMGVVYRAFDPLLQRVVAVKLIGAIEADQERRDRFFREARAAGQLSHKNIITIYDLGEHEGQPFLAMEFLEGQDLQQRMAGPAPMSLARKLELAIEICEGLEYAHLHGVVHRDVKPANIFITNGGIAKILDFGLARLITSDLTNSNMMMGTLNYMAPEQVRGERADHRSDIFSTGVVLYEVLGGRRAFDGDSFAATLYKILEEVPVPLAEIDASLPSELVAVVERALEKSRDARYQHMADMLRDLVAYRQHLMLTSSPAFGSMPPRIAHDAPTIAAPATPLPALGIPPRSGSAAAPLTPAASATPVPGVSTPASGAAMSTRTILAAAGVIALVGASAVWMSTRGDTPGASPAIDSAVTAAPPASPPQPDAARVTAEAVERGLGQARSHLAGGQFEAAAAAAGEVLALAPGNADAQRIMDDASARLRGKGADEARGRMTRARAAAVAAAAPSLAPAPFRAAQAAERDATALLDRGQIDDAMTRFWEASGLFRSAEVAAITEAAVRKERARAQAERPAPDARAGQPAASAPPAATPVIPSTTGLQLPPPAPPIAPPTPPVQPAPQTTPAPSSAAPATKAEPAVESPSPAAGITELLDRYKAALESRNLDALKRLWPGVSSAQESAIRYEFQNASRISVDIASPQITARGTTGTVTFVRRYRIDTVDGQRLSTDTRTTMTVHRAGSSWVIDQIRFEPVR
jgi:serine/threonine protein kinase